MKNTKIQEDLYDYCRWNQTENVKDILEKYPNIIDVLDDNGLFLHLAVSEGNIEMLSTLLEYYDKTKLQNDPETFDYKVAKQKLQIILQDVVNAFDISQEVQSVLNQYLSTEEDSYSEQELGSIEDLIGFDFPRMNDNDQNGDHYENPNHEKPLIGDKLVDIH